MSHSVHCPYFTDDKQEYWWVYIADRKNHALITPPNHVTSLVNAEEVELKFTAPQKPGKMKISFDLCNRKINHRQLVWFSSQSWQHGIFPLDCIFRD